MAEEKLRDTREALRVIHDPGSTPQMRQLAQDVCIACGITWY